MIMISPRPLAAISSTMRLRLGKSCGCVSGTIHSACKSCGTIVSSWGQQGSQGADSDHVERPKRHLVTGQFLQITGHLAECLPFEPFEGFRNGVSGSGMQHAVDDEALVLQPQGFQLG